MPNIPKSAAATATISTLASLGSIIVGVFFIWRHQAYTSTTDSVRRFELCSDSNNVHSYVVHLHAQCSAQCFRSLRSFSITQPSAHSPGLGYSLFQHNFNSACNRWYQQRRDFQNFSLDNPWCICCALNSSRSDFVHFFYYMEVQGPEYSTEGSCSSNVAQKVICLLNNHDCIPIYRVDSCTT